MHGSKLAAPSVGLALLSIAFLAYGVTSDIGDMVEISGISYIQACVLSSTESAAAVAQAKLMGNIADHRNAQVEGVENLTRRGVQQTIYQRSSVYLPPQSVFFRSLQVRGRSYTCAYTRKSV